LTERKSLGYRRIKLEHEVANIVDGEHEHRAEMNPKKIIQALKPTRDIGFELGMGPGL
jgi:hypothetical protein